MCDKCRELLSQGLDLCVRARKMDAMDRRANALAVSSDPERWEASGMFDEYVEQHNADRPHAPISKRSGTVALWLQEQYDADLADWESRARQQVMKCADR